MAGLTVRLFSLFSTSRDPLLPGRASFYPVAIGNFNCRTGNSSQRLPQLILVGSKLTWMKTAARRNYYKVRAHGR
jgi:hypothetical protein